MFIYDFIIACLLITLIVLIFLYYKTIFKWIIPEIIDTTITPSPPTETIKLPQTTSKPPQTTSKPPQTTSKPPQTTSKPPQTTSKPPQTTSKPTQPPTSKLPTIPIPNGIILNLNDKSKSNINFQEYETGRITTSNGILTVTLNPNDGDGNSENSKEEIKKQRNEISVKNKSFVIQKNQTGTWGCYFKINENINWTKSEGFYHLIQIKYNLEGGNKNGIAVQPIFTVSINNNNICARDENGKYTAILQLSEYVNKWIPITVTTTYKENGNISYNINGISGNMTYKNAETELYFKCGQYRKWPNSIKEVTSSSYKDISFKLNN
jgi:hypothetical protein